MRILIDECVDPRVKLLFSPHQVATVHERGWELLAAIENVRPGAAIHVRTPLV